VSYSVSSDEPSPQLAKSSAESRIAPNAHKLTSSEPKQRLPVL
jgi:hypothetical protein